MNYFELYPGDYLRDTTRLTLIEHGAYLRLLMTYYAEEQPLPADEGELFVIVSAITPADKAAVRKVADRFFPVGQDGVRRSGRVEEEIAKARKRIETAKANGSKNKPSGQPKKDQAANPAGMPAGDPSAKPGDTQPPTQSGEALHAPHATLEPSDPNGSGDVPPPAPTNPVPIPPPEPPAGPAPDPIWGTGLAFLVRRGIPEKQARALLGKLRQAAGDIRAGALLADAEAQDITDLVPWLMAGATRPSQQLGKTAQALQTLEEMKRGLAPERTANGFPEIALLEPGSPACG